MDKETLSNYGWIVICVLVLAVMIALATPFGDYISTAVKSTTQGLFDVNKNALNSTGLINVGDQSFSDGTDTDTPETPTKTKLATPVLTFDKGSIYFNKIANVDHYDIYNGSTKLGTVDANGDAVGSPQIITMDAVSKFSIPLTDSTGNTRLNDPTIPDKASIKVKAIPAASSKQYTESDFSNVIEFNWSAPSNTEISFTISGVTYKAKSGMTWKQWVDSAYNTDGWEYDVDEMFLSNSTRRLELSGLGSKGVHETIIAGSNYKGSPTKGILPN